MRILVAGAKGQLAQSIIEVEAAERIGEVVALGRPTLDLCNRESIARAIDRVAPELVVNAAAYTAVDRAESEGVLADAVNGDSAGALAEMAARRGLPIVHVSSDYVFDGRQRTPYRETDAPCPQTAYGKSKLAGEERVAQANPRHLILRTSWVYSPHGHNFVKTILRLAGERPELKVVADQVGCPTFAADLASTILVMARCLQSTGSGAMPWGIYHVAGSGAATWHAFAEHIVGTAAARYGLRPTVVHPIATADYPTPAPRPANSQLDCSKLAEVFGLRLPHWKEGVSRCLAQIFANAEPDPGR